MNKLFNKTDEFLKIGGGCQLFEQKLSAFCTTSDLSAFWALENGINPVLVVANCDGVTGKKASIENMLTSLQPDVFLAVESKLDQSVFYAEFLP